MLFEDAIKIVTNEPDLVVARFGLGSDYRTRFEVLDVIREGMGFSSKKALRQTHPYFNGTSLRDSFRLALSHLVEGNDELGYKIQSVEQEILSKVDLGIHTAVTSAISLDQAFGGNLSARNVAEILYSLRDGKTKRIQDICEETGINTSVPGRHLAHLSEMGIVNFRSYKPPMYSWNKKVESFSGVEDIVINNIHYEASNYRIHRAIEIARQLYDNRTNEFDLTGVEKLIEHRFTSGGSSRNITACGLRNLQRLGFVWASNIFAMGDINSEVSGVIDENGYNPLIDLVVAVKGERTIPQLDVGWEDARGAIYLHDTCYTRRSTPDDRKNQIMDFLSLKGRATRKEITAAIKCGSTFDYLKQLEAEGRLSHQSIKNKHYYCISD